MGKSALIDIIFTLFDKFPRKNIMILLIIAKSFYSKIIFQIGMELYY